MKLVRQIFVLYILLLGVVPCCAMDICHDEENVVMTTTSSNHQEKDDCNNCSPFAFCNNCPGFSLETPAIQIQPVLPATKQDYLPIVINYVSIYFGVLTQPPRFL
ncbi:DUF6660 family protein [Pollutibacter soli]|uniref:DUF6660 family protein n=1 Tax=Pollutibacter soli TaxID=3034157 RepID=UPI0030133864